MRSSGGEVVVSFVGVSEFTIGECGFDWAAHDVRCDYGRNFLAAVSASELRPTELPLCFALLPAQESRIVENRAQPLIGPGFHHGMEERRRSRPGAQQA
jgi:hypothetical protein